MIPNFDVVFSLRGTQDTVVKSYYVWYDSRVDKITKIRKLFRYLHCGSTTLKDCLCIMDDMITTTDKMDSFPKLIRRNQCIQMIQCIIVVMGVNHTRDMVNKMRKMGINILSYFISDYDSDRTLRF